MSKQTAMQQLKDFCEYRLTKATNENKSAWNMILAKIKDDGLIEMEKQQIIQSNRDGTDMVIVDGTPFITGEQYFFETFNK